MTGLGTLEALANAGKRTSKMPILFVGHGSPMNAIEDTSFSRTWQQMGKTMDTPQAILCISAHWYVKGTYVTAMPKPKTIHDFGGFPQALFDVQYSAPGNPSLAKEIQHSLEAHHCGLDMEWGLDHGTWSVLRKMYPLANIPVLQLSIDYTKPPQWHYELAKLLEKLRHQGVLIVGSGNLVHNLRMVAWDKLNESGFGYDWALEINQTFKKHIRENNHAALIAYSQLGPAAALAIPTPDHYLPMLYILGLQQKSDELHFFNDEAMGGSLTMTSFILQ